jgi:hypothetical protein
MAGMHSCRVPRRLADGYVSSMTTVQIEHPISDFTTWKAAFDRAAPLREQSRVRSWEIHQPVDDPAYVTIRLEFDNVEDANGFLVKLRALWSNREATPALRGTPIVRVLERKA